MTHINHIPTDKADLDTLTCKDAWELVRQHNAKQIEIPDRVLLSSTFAVILAEAPENIVTTTVNNFVIETSDCWKRHYFRIQQLENKWFGYRDINMWNVEMSWEPQYLEFKAGNENHLICLDDFTLFKPVVN